MLLNIFLRIKFEINQQMEHSTSSDKAKNNSVVTEIDTQKNKKKALKASIFVIFGYGLSQVIRLAGNLILTRLLIPEYFGIIALAQVFFTGLSLFSDIGLEPGVIRSKRSDDPVFLNTAWTLQVIRGPILWFLSILIAYPISLFYNEPILVFLIPVISFRSVIEGFRSTSIYILNKNLYQGLLTLIELVSQTVGLIVIVVVALFTRSIWALAIGGLVNQIVRTVWSHMLNKDAKHRFLLEKESVKELISFGKWIFFSTAMMFLATQADRLILGKLFTLSFFGIYNIAVIFAEVSKQVVNRLSGKVIFPYLSHFKDYSSRFFKKELSKHRKMFLFPMAVFVGVLTVFGDRIIIFLYDPRYEQAAWILPLLAIGMWPLILTATIDRTLLVVGKPKYIAYGNMLKFFYMLLFVPFFYRLWGTFGAVLAVSLNDVPFYFSVAVGLIREKLSLFRQDILATLFLLLVLFLCMFIRIIFGLEFTGLSVFNG